MTSMLTAMNNARGSSLGLIVLAMLCEEPMHPYRMQRLIEQRGKDRVVNVRHRASLYQTIERLLRLGLIEVRETVRGGKYPDRVVYAITDEGRATARAWLRDVLRTPGPEFPDFPAAVSILTLLTPEEAREQIAARRDRVAAELAEIGGHLRAYRELPRLFLLEEEYRRTVLAAELTWLREVEEDLRAGRLTWNDEWLQRIASELTPDEESRHDGND